jgi:D-alanyl-D-alanine carboxypeptidase (penicillin-binding protein 5/6)
MRKIAIIIISVLVLINAAPIVSYGATEPPAILAETAVLIDAKTGQVLYDKLMNEQREPASTTKVITALLALENLELNKLVTIDAETPFTEGSRIYLLEGENVTVEQLLYALLLESANDAAVALGKRYPAPFRHLRS